MKKVVVSMLILVLLSSVAGARFAEQSVDEVTSLERVAKKAGTFTVQDGGLDETGKRLRVGALCEEGTYLNFLKCSDEEGSSCEPAFEKLWEIAGANDYLYLSDHEETNEGNFAATYECYAVKDNAQTTSENRETQAQVNTAQNTGAQQRTTASATSGSACSVSVSEGEEVKLSFEGSDPDSDDLTYTFDFGKANTKFRKTSSNGVDIYSWQTQKGDGGTYPFSATVTDGEGSSTTGDCILVKSVNSVPKLTGVRDITVREGERVESAVSCADEDGDATTVTYSGWMQSSSKATGFSDAGTYTVSVSCSDSNGGSDTASFSVTVQNVNRKPSISWKVVS